MHGQVQQPPLYIPLLYSADSSDTLMALKVLAVAVLAKVVAIISPGKKDG